MILTLFDRDRALDLVLPERVTGRYVLTTIDQEQNPMKLMAVEAEDGQWYLKSNKYAYIKNSADNNEKTPKVLVEPFKTYTIYRDNEPPALLYIEPPSIERNEYTKHYVTTNTIKIGRGKDSQICFSTKLVSSSHCIIEYTSNGYPATIRDLDSSNGTYVNGKRIHEAALNIGDVIYIMGLKMIFNGRMLSLNNPHRLVFLDRSSFRPFATETPVIQEDEPLDELHTEEGTEELFYRSPRFKRDIEKATIKIDPPPQKNNLDETPLMLLLGPSVTMGMASLFTGVFMLQNVMSSGGNIMMAMPMLVMSISMLIGSILWPILTKRHEKKKRNEQEGVRQEKYLQYLREMKQVIDDECQYQSEILHENHLPLKNLLQRIKQRDRSLWERTAGQNDFLKVRLGLGDLPLHADIKYPEKKFTIDDDNLQDELYKLVESQPTLKRVPVTFSIEEEQVSGIIGERKAVQDFVKDLIFQLTTLHSYDELKLVFLFDKSELETWKFAKWLPHVWNDDQDIRFIATDANEVKELSAYLEKEISSRAASMENDPDLLAPHYLVFSMNQELAAKAEAMNLLLKEKKKIGFSLITLYDELKNLPKECSMVIELHNDFSKIYDKDDISGRYTAFHADVYHHESEEELAIQLANIQLASKQKSYTLPEMLTFLEMFGVSKIEHLNVLTRWKENNPTLTIETPIGVNTMGEPFKLDLHEKYHGPHGLIAGMTGSGKSEFIMTFILSLAVNYHPDEVAFILIDYKGGGMANSFTQLPHLAGTITNLDGAAVKRSLISIQSELKRRQAIFSETSRRINQSNLDIYKYQKFYREGLVSEPLQHLFIISDEFAELKTQQPEFMEQLVSAARIGRSLGVHLILATQKPSGVVDDQIWSNSKFRISLKVQEKADSMEVIKRPDAAELSTTGRFYLQVGYNELFEMGQSAWAGAPYYPADKVEKSKDNSILVIDNLGRVLKSAKMDQQKNGQQNPPKQLDGVTMYLANLAKQENINVRPLWLEPIAAFIYLDQLKQKYKITEASHTELNPVIGEYDDPANQSQEVMRFPISRDGNAILYGVAGSGKTTFLSTLIYSLMEDHTPDDVNLYLLDFSSETLSWFAAAPHVGDVVLSHEAEKINNLLKLLTKEIDHRKKLFANYGGDFTSYIEKSDSPLPSIVVAIHNYSAFSEMYDQFEEEVSYLTREGIKYGIYFILTVSNTGAVRYKLLQNFKQMYVLQLNDQTEYSGILGSVDGVYPSNHKGRGIFKNDQVYEFQTARITDEAADMYTYITDYCQELRRTWTGKTAKRVPILPEKVDANYLRGQQQLPGKVPVGVDKSSLEIISYDYNDSFINLVLSNSEEQGASFMQGLAELLADTTTDEVIFIDPNERLGKISGKNGLEETTVMLFNTLVDRNNTKKEAIEQGIQPPEFTQITCLIDRFTDFSQQLSADAQDKLRVFLEKGASLNVTLIISDSADKLSVQSYENWFKSHVSLYDAIWIGNGISEQYLLKLSKVTSDMYQEIPDDFGYVVKKGKTTMVKLLSSSEQKEGVVQIG